LVRLASIASRPTIPSTLVRSHTGISAGVFHRIDQLVLGLDYFRARYDFDARIVDPDDPGPILPVVVEPEQTVQIVNAGVTVEW
jgi:hypothetical protein